jgi:hypothetical protein
MVMHILRLVYEVSTPSHLTAIVEVTFYTCIREVLGSNLGQDTRYLD